MKHIEIPHAAVPKVERSRLSFDPFADEEDVEETAEEKADQQAHPSVPPFSTSDVSGSAPSSVSAVAESSSTSASTAAATTPVPAEAASASSSSPFPAAPAPSEDSPISPELFAERKSLLRMRLERERSDYRAARPQSDVPVGDPLALGGTTLSVDAPSLSGAKGEPEELPEEEKQQTSASAPISSAFKKKKRLGVCIVWSSMGLFIIALVV